MSRAPQRPRLRSKVVPPPATDNAAARAARDQARARPFHGSAATLTLAGSWQDLITSVSVDPSPPAFDRPCTIRFDLSHRAVGIQLAGKLVHVALSGSASATASLSLYVPEPPPLHAWKCSHCPQTFTINPSQLVCKPGHAPVLHDFQCTRQWTSGPPWDRHDHTCNSGLGFPPTCGAGGFHDYRCGRGSCGNKKLTDIIGGLSSFDSGWLDRARQTVCVEGQPDTLHSWRCTRCNAQFSDGIRNATCGPPGRPPEVSGSFTATASVKLDLSGLAERLVVAVGPHELIGLLPRVGDLVVAAYHDALSGVVGRLTGAFPVDGPFRGSFDQACRNATAPLVQAFAGAALPRFVPLRDAVSRFARDHLAGLDELFPDLVELLALAGDPPGTIDLAGQLLADALRTSPTEAMWSMANWLLGFCSDTLPAAAEQLAARMLLAVKDGFVTQRGQLDVFLADAMSRVAGHGGDVLSFARGVLATVRDGAAGANAFLAGVAVAFASAGPDFARALGSLTGVLCARGTDANAILDALFDELARVRQLSGDEVKLFASHLGDDALLKTAVTWLRDHWGKVQALLKEGADKLREWIDYVLGLAEKVGHPFAFPEHDRLVGLLKWLQGLPGALLHPDALGDVGAHIASLTSVLRGGFLSWLDEGARRTNTTAGQFFKDFVTKTNPLVQSAQRMRAAVLPILGQEVAQAAQLSEQVVDAGVKAIYELQEWEKRLWSIIYGDGLGVGPITAQLAMHGLSNDAIKATGAQIEMQAQTALSSALQGGDQVIAGLGVPTAADQCFLSIDLLRQALKVPHPTVSAPIRFPTGGPVPPIPINLPVPWDAGVAICHLPEFYMIDMRYHYPYGDVGVYHVADLDNDGFVRDWEVRKLRAAVARARSAEDFYDFALDCDGDGKITERDLELALQQQRNYVNGLMYRKATAPLGYFVALAPTVWAFVTFTDLTEESTIGGIQRRGFADVIDAQIAIPLPPIFKDGQNYYPIRLHYEDRMFVDKLDGLVPSLGQGTPPPIAPLTASARVDLVLRGGKTGRDWQVYFTSEPFNPMLYTFNLRGTLYLRGAASAGGAAAAAAGASAGAAAKGATYIHFDYECSAPIIAVIEEWVDRFRDIAETQPGDLPVPWTFIKGILEWTDVPRLARALILIAGPIIDLLFDWCDKGHHIRGVLGYIRQYTLNNWRPAPTWQELRKEILGWDDVGYVEKQAILAGVTDAQGKARAGDEDAVYVPWLLARTCKERLASVPAGALAAAEARVAGCFERGRERFAASLDQLVPAKDDDDPYVDSLSIPLCGAFNVLNPFIFAVPIRWEDLAGNAKPSESTLDQMMSVRGNPFYKPIYHTLVEFGPEAKLFSCPNRDLNYFIASVAGQKGLVEGSRVLEDASGNRWLWVRTDAYQHGWVYIDAAVCEALFSVKEAAEVAGHNLAEDLLKDVLAKAGPLLPVSVMDEAGVGAINHGLDDLFERLAGKKQRPTITKIEASARHTVDESAHARVCRAALARIRANRATDADRAIHAVYNRALLEFDMRLCGANLDVDAMIHPRDVDALEVLGKKLSGELNKLGVPKREKLWAAGTAWLKIVEYMPDVVLTVIDELMPPLLAGDIERAWQVVLSMLRRIKNVRLEELLLVAQTCAPALKEVILTMVDMGIKLKSIKDAVTKGEMGFKGSGEVGQAGGGGKEVTFRDVGTQLVRLLIDDEEEPGRPSRPKRERRGRPNHDHGISFSFEVTVKVTEEKGKATRAKKETNERVVALAEPYIARIQRREVEVEDEDDLGVVEEGGDDAVPDGQSDEDGDGPAPGEGADDDEDAEEEENDQAAAGKAIELQVTEWGAIIHSDPPTAALVGAARVPREWKDAICWQVAVVGDDGEPGDWEDIEEQGENIRYEVPTENVGKKLEFRAYVEDFDWSLVGKAEETSDA